METRPTFILHGRIVTMNSDLDVLENHFLAVKNGQIAAIAETEEQLPAEFRNKKIIRNAGTIYPGLIDLHNHFAYNCLTLWQVPKRYDNRGQWQGNDSYKALVSKPVKEVITQYTNSAKALVRFIESKALFGGITTGQGINTQVKGGQKNFRGSMRNVEAPGDSGLLPAGSKLPDLIVTGNDAAKNIEEFRKAINRPGQGAYFYHLSEGTDDTSRKHFMNLKNNDLINPNLVGIHSLGLEPDDLAHFAKKGGKVVWSPFSNCLLYGKTLDLKALKNSGVLFSLGCDWSPSGSKNLLFEMKVAAYCNEQQGEVFSNEEIVKMVTSEAAKVVQWQDKLGSIETTKYADLLVISGIEGNPYEKLINSIDHHIALVIVDGIARYGEYDFMKELHFNPNFKIEKINCQGHPKGAYLYTDTSELNEVTFEKAVEMLKTVMSDLPGYKEKMEAYFKNAFSLVDNPETEFRVIVDNDFEDAVTLFPNDPQLLKLYNSDTLEALAEVEMPKSVELDETFVDGERYWDRIKNQQNIPDGLKTYLKQFYP